MAITPTPEAFDTARLGLTKLSGSIGARAEVSLDAVLEDGTTQQALKAALHEHLVLVFPRLSPSPQQQEQLARTFGDLQPVESYNVAHPDAEYVTVFDSVEGYKADRWHSDATWREEVPMGASLCMVRCPSYGGDTLFANTHAAWDSLSGGMRSLLAGRRALHEIGPGSSFEHPVVIAHPVTGRPALFVNRIFTRGITNLPQEESDAVLPFLMEHVSRPEFTYRHRWQEGDVVIWDNWATQHYAVFDYDEQRIAHRVAFIGQALEAADVTTGRVDD
ncbi:MAG: taurine dioxygenase [Actinomycetia bacterium]|nr:taurine dioxygenase [Actinomycetes bacterium]